MMDNKDKSLQKYEDILYLPHPVSKIHAQMSIMNRAAQFAPFAALTGYDEAVKEMARLTDKRPELDQDEIIILNSKLLHIQQELLSGNEPKVEIEFFRKDEKKDGGAIVSLKGEIKKLDNIEHEMVLKDDRKIKLETLISVNELLSE